MAKPPSANVNAYLERLAAVFIGLRVSFERPEKVLALQRSGRAPSVGQLFLLVIASLFLLSQVLGEDLAGIASPAEPPFVEEPMVEPIPEPNGELPTTGVDDTADNNSRDADSQFSGNEVRLPLLEKLISETKEFLTAAFLVGMPIGIVTVGATVAIGFFGMLFSNNLRNIQFGWAVDYILVQALSLSLATVVILAISILLIQIATYFGFYFNYIDFVFEKIMGDVYCAIKRELSEIFGGFGIAASAAILAPALGAISGATSLCFHLLERRKWLAVLFPGFLLGSYLFALLLPLTFFRWTKWIYTVFGLAIVVIYSILFLPLLVQLVALYMAKALGGRAMLWHLRRSRKNNVKASA